MTAIDHDLEAELRAAQRSAVSDSIPLLLPAIPFGFVLGVAINESVMPDGVGLLSSAVIAAGAAQLALVGLVGTASVWAAIATALVINARHVMYSAAIAPAFKGHPRWFRWLGPIMLIDQVFALTIQRADDKPAVFRRYYAVVASMFFVVWQLVTLMGLVFGSVIPASWQLGYAPAVMFAGLVVFGLDRRPAVVAAIVGASVCYLAIGLPNRSGLLLGAVCGVIAGSVAERAANRRVVSAA